MATSDVSICNIALQILGEGSITSLTQNTEAARACNTVFEETRDSLLEEKEWTFALAQEILAPDTDTPKFDWTYQFTLPVDCLRPLLKEEDNTWQEMDGKILTNDGDTLYLEYIKKVTDATKFHKTFVQALAAKIAYNSCERVTGSNVKQDLAMQRYDEAMAKAARLNAYRKESKEPAPSSWETARL